MVDKIGGGGGGMEVTQYCAEWQALILAAVNLIFQWVGH